MWAIGDAVELDGRRIDRRHREAGGPEDRDPDEIAVAGVDDPVFMRVDQDGRRRRGVGRDGTVAWASVKVFSGKNESLIAAVMERAGRTPRCRSRSTA